MRQSPPPCSGRPVPPTYDGPVATSRDVEAPRTSLRELYRTMCRIEAFEERAEQAFGDGRMLGALHLSIGQEAVAAGVCAHLADADLITSTHRGHGHALAKGVDPTAMMCELLGRVGGTCGGKGGSMHIADLSVGMLGANGIVPGRADRRRRRRPRAQAARDRCRRGQLLRRRRRQSRALPGGAELGAGAVAAGPVRVRGQRLRLDHSHRRDDRRGGRGRARPRPRRAGARGRRQRRVARWRRSPAS